MPGSERVSYRIHGDRSHGVGACVATAETVESIGDNAVDTRMVTRVVGSGGKSDQIDGIQVVSSASAVQSCEQSQVVAADVRVTRVQALTSGHQFLLIARALQFVNRREALYCGPNRLDSLQSLRTGGRRVGRTDRLCVWKDV